MKVKIRKQKQYDRLWVIWGAEGIYLGKKVGWISRTFSDGPTPFQIRNDLSLNDDKFVATLDEAKKVAKEDFEKTEA